MFDGCVPGYVGYVHTNFVFSGTIIFQNDVCLCLSSFNNSFSIETQSIEELISCTQ
jgi:hypothetical protein